MWPIVISQRMVVMIIIPLTHLSSTRAYFLVQANRDTPAVLYPWQFNSQHHQPSAFEVNKGAQITVGESWSCRCRKGIKHSKAWALKMCSRQSFYWEGKCTPLRSGWLSLPEVLLCSFVLWLSLSCSALRALWSLFFPDTAMGSLFSGKHSCTKLVFSKCTLLKEKPKWNRRTVNSIK